MKRLSHEQFKRRMTPPPALSSMLEGYTRALDYGDHGFIMGVELPLMLTEMMPPLSARPDALPDLSVILLRGYRVIEVKRDRPDDPAVKAVYSTLTRQFHRVSWSNERVFNGDRITEAGYGILLHVRLPPVPDPIDDNLIRLAMLTDLLPPPARCWAAWYIGNSQPPARYVKEVAEKVTGEKVRVCSTEPESIVHAWKRVFGYDRAVLAKMWAIVDEYGMPEGPVGEALKGMDKFRTD